jgi:predicted nucleotidyltransferase
MQTQFTKQEVIDEMTRRLVDFYHPVRIYLFGSEARGEAGPDSDLDFLVVVPDDTPEFMKPREFRVAEARSGWTTPTPTFMYSVRRRGSRSTR